MNDEPHWLDLDSHDGRAFAGLVRWGVAILIVTVALSACGVMP